ncbi:MAG: hypothetical protein RBU27_00425 [Bacteroidota bacterium]|jgi:hypothetical protein|nr:hypothetical protein [Bacteroidota bacterium]
MRVSISLLVALILAAAAVHGQEHATEPRPASAPPRDTTAALVLSLGGGASRYVMPHDARLDIDREGAAYMFRLCLHTSRRLRAGVESGWTLFYSYELNDVETSFGHTDAGLTLSAIPVLAVFSMPVFGSLTVHAGTGGYFVRSHATSFGETVDVVRFAQGWMAALSWDVGVFRQTRVGAELKWYGATEFDDGVVLLQLRMSFPLLTW